MFCHQRGRNNIGGHFGSRDGIVHGAKISINFWLAINWVALRQVRSLAKKTVGVILQLCGRFDKSTAPARRQRTACAQRLDCGRFTAVLERQKIIRFLRRARSRESAAEAGAVQTLRDAAANLHFEDTT
jgi:hypothetical protein